MNKAGLTIRQLAQKRQNMARRRFLLVGILAITPLLLYFFFAFTGISLLINLVCWVYAFIFFQRGKKLLWESQRANQGAEAEESVALVLSELESEGWQIEYNLPVSYWGDVDAFLCSPRGNCFVVDTKSDSGTVFFDGTRLMKRYGQKIRQFSNNKDILKAARGQAVTLKEIKQVRFVTPMLCFTKATLAIEIIDHRVEGVYISSLNSLISLLRRLD